MSKRVPQLSQTADHLIGAAAQIDIHGSPRIRGEKEILLYYIRFIGQRSQL